MTQIDSLNKLGIELKTDGLIIKKEAGTIFWRFPSFPLSGGVVSAHEPCFISQKQLRNGIEIALQCEVNDTVFMKLFIRASDTSHFVRLRYELHGDSCFAGTDGIQTICYGILETEYEALTEISLSEFDRIQHSYVPCERHYNYDRLNNRELNGPIICIENKSFTALLAYEHGAQAPDSFFKIYALENGVMLRSNKGNYYNDMPVGVYRAPWINIGITAKSEILQKFREHVINGISISDAFCRPYIFYNTWNYQERLKIFKDKPYLAEMNEERMLSEIDIAHNIGIDVFVIDTGWFSCAGDWNVDKERFPQGLKPIKDKLDSYNMKLGLWFNPTLASKNAAMLEANSGYIMKTKGKDWFLDAVWEKEGCYGLCFASGFSDFLVEKFVSLNQELGVSYFKWDGIYQYGCESSEHYHGTENNDNAERLEAYAYRMGLEMTRVAEEIACRCPGAIVDFDITEGGRYVGMGFLSGGKFFSVNNGPYYNSFDIPGEAIRQPDTINVFFYPGAARSQICRASSRFDKYIPSTLYLTHYLPEGTKPARNNAAASLVLGGNGIWGDLLALNEAELNFWHDFIIKYKKVRDFSAAAYPVTVGEIGNSPEIHEKLDKKSAAGFITFFTSGAGTFTHITQPLYKKPAEVIGAEHVQFLEDGRVKISVSIGEDDAATVFFMP